MLQRKQSVFWLLVALLSSWLVFGNVKFFEATLKTDFELQKIITTYSARYFESNQDSDLNMMVKNHFVQFTFALVSILACATLLLFKRRNLQMKLTFLQIGLVIIGLYFMFQSSYSVCQNLRGENTIVQSFHYSIEAFIPLTLILFEILAYRYTLKDENLIKSVNRLR